MEKSNLLTEQSPVVVQIPIGQVRPDPIQPRRWLPRDLAGALTSGTPPIRILTELRERCKRTKWIRVRLVNHDALTGLFRVTG
jgi:hypothetical protein